MSLYELLGVKKDATIDTIAKAYKKAAMKHHPDRGGDEETFKAVKEAYEVLSDPERRAEYDRTGQTKQQMTARAAAMEGIAQMMADAMDNVDTEYSDVFKACRDQIHQKVREQISRRDMLRNKIEKRQKALKRIIFNGEGEDIASRAIEYDIVQIEGQLKRAEAAVDVMNEMLVLLQTYEYKHDKPTNQFNPADAWGAMSGMHPLYNRGKKK